ncbi:MAG TPA: class I tRNA ligase family protein [Methanomicrobiales archaeon]|nr:class I tRNA ligase family protein [Methanomicrobiales archaeon]
MLRIYNTMARRKEPFRPRAPPVVKFFTCGPSIYQAPHLGNYRTFLYEDVLERYLGYLGFQVERVLPFTDVEDKAIAQAEKEGVTLPELTGRVAEEFFREACLLRLKPPTWNPRSSTTVGYAVEVIERLLAKKVAYRHGPDIFFDPLKFPGFGKLFRLDMSRWPKKRRRFAKDTYPGVQWNYGDFILWHGARKGDTVSWDTRIGRGRPSWNVQDPGMVIPFLGNQIDIHAGGIDNLWRHHDYNLAIVESLTGREYARYWMHGEHLLIDGRKMSKSRGNIVHLSDLTAQGCTPEEVRFFLTYGHYRDRMNMTGGNLEAAREVLRDLKALVDRVTGGGGRGRGRSLSRPADAPPALALEEMFRERMDDDLDVRGAVNGVIVALQDMAARKDSGELPVAEAAAALAALHRIDGVLQVIFPPGQA